jgi:UDP-N-acetylmuramoyl-tripeptide--D-alanyl-D-alanine ligase
LHEEVGRCAADLKIDRLFTIGKFASHFATGARAAGLKAVVEYEDVDSAAPALKKELMSGDVVLLKASRSMRLERVADFLKNKNAQ